MAATLLAMFKRPDGGEEALLTFKHRYRAEHLPLIAKVPGLRDAITHEVAHQYAGEDLVLVTRMLFDDRAALEAAMSSDEMRAAGRNLRDIAPGLLTLVALDDDAHGEAR